MSFSGAARVGHTIPTGTQVHLPIVGDLPLSGAAVLPSRLRRLDRTPLSWSRFEDDVFRDPFSEEVPAHLHQAPEQESFDNSLNMVLTLHAATPKEVGGDFVVTATTMSGGKVAEELVGPRVCVAEFYSILAERMDVREDGLQLVLVDGQLLDKADVSSKLAKQFGFQSSPSHAEFCFVIPDNERLSEAVFETKAEAAARLEGLDPGCVEPTALEFIDACGVACTHDEGDPVWTWSRDRFPVIVKVSCDESAGTLPPADLVSKGRGRARWQDTLVGPPLRGDSHTVVMLVTSFGTHDGTRQWLLNFGQKGFGAHIWCWTGENELTFGSWGGHRSQLASIVDCRRQVWATVYDGHFYKLYIGGQFVGKSAARFSIEDNTVAIGQSALIEGDFSGTIEEVRIFRRALFPSQISALTKTLLAEDPSDLVLSEKGSYWRQVYQLCTCQCFSR